MTIINDGLSEETFSAILEFEKTPSWHLIGFYTSKVSPGKAWLEIEVEEKHLNTLGLCHGGIIATVADTAMGVAMRTTGPNGVTIEININFIRPAKPGDILVAEGEVLHRGRKSVVCESKVYNKENRKLIAVSRGMFLMPDS